MKLPFPPNLAWPHVSPTASLLLSSSNCLIDIIPSQFTELLNCLDSVPLSYLVDVMLLIDDGEREKGAGIRGIILWDKELERETHRLGWGGSEAPRESRKGTEHGRVSTLRTVWPSSRD